MGSLVVHAEYSASGASGAYWLLLVTAFPPLLAIDAAVASFVMKGSGRHCGGGLFLDGKCLRCL